MTTIICDRCGEAVKRNKTIRDILCEDINCITLDYKDKYYELINAHHFDLCDNCAKELIKWLNVEDRF